jgi:uncharacterized membrane protein YphA (DoxX/SURF4 family)
MKTLKIICRIAVGLVFIFSAFVKGVDPLGSAYKFGDYFVAFGMSSLDFLTLPMSFFLSTAEFVIGVALLWGIRMPFFSWAVLVFMTAFALLTLNLAIYDPVSDCGCFGDAIILSNWETFYKNLAIMVLVLVIFQNRWRFKQLYQKRTEWGIVVAFVILFLGFMIYNYTHLPVMDYRPYHVGSYLPEKMEIPEGAPHDEYETIFYYKNLNSGEVKKFESDNYPWKDTANWEFVKYEDELIKKGYEPPIHDFNIISYDGTNYTDQILNDTNYSFLLISHNLTHANEEGLQDINSIAQHCDTTSKFSFYGLTATVESEKQRIKDNLALKYNFYVTDEVTLKTIVRANPGLLLLKNGTVIAKWHYNSLPKTENMDAHYFADLLNIYRNKYENRFAVIFSMSLLFIIGLFILLREKLCKKNE